MKISALTTFGAMPANYSQVDNFLSRSAQPLKDDFVWLKQQGVTDVINFRTMYTPAIDFNEENLVKELGMKYYNIPSRTRHPQEANIFKFLILMDNITQNSGKAHIHCKAGADRTGMYAFIYKSLKNIGTIEANKAEWLRFGHNQELYPNLMNWTEKFVRLLKKLK